VLHPTASQPLKDRTMNQAINALEMSKSAGGEVLSSVLVKL